MVNNFSNNLKKYRLQYNYTVKDIALLIGIHPESYRKYDFERS